MECIYDLAIPPDTTKINACMFTVAVFIILNIWREPR